MTVIADNISILMDRKGVSAYQIERDTQRVIKQSTLSRILNGERDPRRSTIKKIADYFGVKVGHLLGEEPIPENRFTEYPAGPLPEGCDAKLWAKVPGEIDPMHLETLAGFAEVFVRDASLNDARDQRLLKEIYYEWLERRRLKAYDKKSLPVKTPVK